MSFLCVHEKLLVLLLLIHNRIDLFLITIDLVKSLGSIVVLRLLHIHPHQVTSPLWIHWAPQSQVVLLLANVAFYLKVGNVAFFEAVLNFSD